MCVVVFNTDTQEEASSPEELIAMLEIPAEDLVQDADYANMAIDMEACLCTIDCRATIEKAGYVYIEINGDHMDVAIHKFVPK